MLSRPRIFVFLSGHFGLNSTATSPFFFITIVMVSIYWLIKSLRPDSPISILQSFSAVWEERVYGVLWHAFSMGRQQALSIIEEVQYKKLGEIIRLEDYPRRTTPLSDKRIRSAAKLVRGADAMVKAYMNSSEPEHKFSPEFEQKMQRLINGIDGDSHQ